MGVLVFFVYIIPRLIWRFYAPGKVSDVWRWCGQLYCAACRNMYSELRVTQKWICVAYLGGFMSFKTILVRRKALANRRRWWANKRSVLDSRLLSLLDQVEKLLSSACNGVPRADISLPSSRSCNCSSSCQSSNSSISGVHPDRVAVLISSRSACWAMYASRTSTWRTCKRQRFKTIVVADQTKLRDRSESVIKSYGSKLTTRPTL